MSRRRLIVFYWLPVLVWMALIFIASSDPESGARGSRILEPIIRFFVPGISRPALDQTIFVARKLIHFGSFAVLALLFWRVFARDHARVWRSASAVRALTGTLLYAISDEFHQSFVPTRVASAMDVVIDMFGAVSAMACLWLWYRLWRRSDPSAGR